MRIIKSILVGFLESVFNFIQYQIFYGTGIQRDIVPCHSHISERQKA